MCACVGSFPYLQFCQDSVQISLLFATLISTEISNVCNMNAASPIWSLLSEKSKRYNYHRISWDVFQCHFTSRFNQQWIQLVFHLIQHFISLFIRNNSQCPSRDGTRSVVSEPIIHLSTTPDPPPSNNNVINVLRYHVYLTRYSETCQVINPAV